MATAKPAAKYKISCVRWWLQETEIAPGKNFSINMELRNVNPFHDMKDNLACSCEEDDFFVANMTVLEPLAKQKSTTLKVEMLVKPADNLDKLPATKVLKFVDENEVEFYRVTIAIPIEPFVKHLLTLEPLRILLWGQIGTGKSAFVNSAYSLLNPNPHFPGAIGRYAASRPANSSVTLNFVRYTAGEMTEGSFQPIPKDVNVSLYDTWGWETTRDGDSYPSLIIPYLLNGALPDNYSLRHVRDFDRELDRMKPNPSKAPNAVFIAMTVGAADNEPYVKKIKELLPLFTNRGLQPIVLVTQIDQVDPKMRADPFAQHPTVRSVLQRVSTKIGIDLGDIVPMVNYTEESERTWGIDRAIYVALRKAYLYSKKVNTTNSK